MTGLQATRTTGSTTATRTTGSTSTNTFGTSVSSLIAYDTVNNVGEDGELSQVTRDIVYWVTELDPTITETYDVTEEYDKATTETVMVPTQSVTTGTTTQTATATRVKQ